MAKDFSLMTYDERLDWATERIMNAIRSGDLRSEIAQVTNVFQHEAYHRAWEECNLEQYEREMMEAVHAE